MRISDRNSDVCSSDLTFRAGLCPFHERCSRRAARPLGCRLRGDEESGDREGPVAEQGQMIGAGNLPYSTPRLRRAAPRSQQRRQIGRAACRESVWQNEKIAVIDVAVKKKSTKY